MKKDFLIDAYKKLLFVRRTEELIADEYRNGSMKTPTHFGIGQEACAVGVCLALRKRDVVFTHHRSHTHYLAKGGSSFKLIAELMGKSSGCSLGRGGSVHIIDKSNNFYGSSPILGHSSALSVGAALAFKLQKKDTIAVSFFGEGAFDEGSVWESLNYSATNNLKVLFVCENNLYATESPLNVRMPKNTSFSKKVAAFGVKVFDCDGNDFISTFDVTKKALKYISSGKGPVLIHAFTYRWREHVGPLYDYEANRLYRSRRELNKWIKKCPVKRLEQYLLQKKWLTLSSLETITTKIEKKIISDLNRAIRAETPKPSELFLNCE